MEATTPLSSPLTIVIKIGTSSLINTHDPSTGAPSSSLNLKQMAATVETASTLRALGHRVVLVTSGAVGAGCHCLNLHARPSSLSTRQALAAIGQVHLMSKYEAFFTAMKRTCAQVLLTYDTFRWKEQYQNAENTFRELFHLGIVPVVNENDTVATQELRSENDTLAAMIASLVKADRLFLMTDVDGVFTANPNEDPNARLIPYVEDVNTLESMIKLNDPAQSGSTFGTGGMAVKVNAARLATSLGIQTTIMRADLVEEIVKLIYVTKEAHFTTGTTFAASREHPSKRKRWIRGLRINGKVELDDGAVAALKERKNLYTVGVTRVEGQFSMMSAVMLVDQEGNELGSGLVNYSSEDLRVIKGKHTDEISKCGVSLSGPMMHRKNLVVNFPRSEAEKKKKEEENRSRGRRVSIGMMDSEDDSS